MTMAERVERARALVDRTGHVPATLHRATEDLFPDVDGLPDVHLSELTVDRLASGIQHHGGMVVRGLLATDQVEGLRTQLRDGTLRAKQGGASSTEVDHMVAMLIDAYRTQGVLDLAERYLGEAPVGFPHRTVVNATSRRPGCRGIRTGRSSVGRAVRSTCGPRYRVRAQVPEPVARAAPHRAHPRREPDDGGRQLDRRGRDAPGARGRRGGAAGAAARRDAILLDEMTVHRTGTGVEIPSREVAVTSFFAPSRLPALTAPPIASRKGLHVAGGAGRSAARAPHPSSGSAARPPRAQRSWCR